jgi:pyruvate/2-oxoglutarate dehydrogenase complex dihydrolipoamide dehydrogenase (E3) component
MEPRRSPADPRFPVDDLDRLLLERVRPADWVQPTPRDRYDLVVIGAGTGGLVTAAIAAALGARVALVERGLMGGDCLNVGCVPSKALIRAATAWEEGRRAHRRLGAPAPSGAGDFATVMRRLRSLRAEISSHDSAARFRDLGVDVFLGEGRFSGGDRVEVDDRTLRFRRAVIATGARAAELPVPGLRELGYLTNESVFSLTELPRTLLVVGGGAIGCELAQAFVRLGSDVTLLEAADRILPGKDSDAAAVVRRALETDGVRVITGARLTNAESGKEQRAELGFRVEGREEKVGVEEVLVAVGRAPNVEDLDLHRAGVECAENGVMVDERLRTSNRRVFAIGDVASSLRFTHLADAHARIVVRNALFHGRAKATELVVPRVTYTSPEVAHVQAARHRLRRAGDPITVHFAEIDRARIDGDTEGFLRLHLAHGSDTILAATVVGKHAGEIISHLTTAITREIGLSRLGETIFPYPTHSEILRRAADQHRRGSLTPTIRRGMSLYFRATRRF